MKPIRNLRDYIEVCEAEGEVKRVKAEVDWDLELSHIAKINEEQGGPALLFENVKGCLGSVLIGVFSSPKRMAIALGMPPEYTMCQMADEWRRIGSRKPIPSVEVNTGPIMENIVEEKDIDLTKFPAPKYFPLDGGRFMGTSAFRITRDPETGELEIGMGRMQLYDEKNVGLYLSPGRGGDKIRAKYEKLGKPAPFALVFGCDPALALASVMFIKGASKYDIAGTLRGIPVETVVSDFTGLPIPAEAELVVEGFMDHDDLRPEGPFGDVTGLYTSELQKPIPKRFVKAKRVLYRNDPIMLANSSGRPVSDVQMMISLPRTAALWQELEAMKIPGIKSVYIPPQMAGRFWAIVSVKTQYPGHANQVAHAVISTTTGHLGIKGVIVVDDDIAADDMDRVLWALATRYLPDRDTEIIKRGRSSPLDPAVPPETGYVEIISKILIDATVPYEWPQKPVVAALDEEVVKKVKSRWKEYGLD
ncbi:MAG: phenylphosphate carboxylase subunit beta [Clostridia bacterium]|nr:MAG: phenylphosphate carboxylase subunit beta [Clostridia bacterium]